MVHAPSKSGVFAHKLWVCPREFCVPGYSAKIAYRYRIDSSLDKTTWEPIADASENREFREVYEHTIPKRLARYIRLTTLPLLI